MSVVGETEPEMCEPPATSGGGTFEQGEAGAET